MRDQTAPNAARFPFGHGLTHARVKAVEVAQLYVRNGAASITQPVRRLIDFRRLLLAPGQSAPVRLTITRVDLTLVGLDLLPIVEPTPFAAA